jgi:DNA-binding transcriptional MerR regulator
MSKPIAQIAFDFSAAEEEKEILLPEQPVPSVAPLPPVVITVPEEVFSTPLVITEEIEEEIAAQEPDEEIIIRRKPTLNPALTANKRGRRSLKDIGLTADLIQVPEDEVLFQKQYYSIGEVAIMFRENQSLIRYWETEFDILKPRKNRKGDRFFRPVDVKNLVMIYDLLRRRKFTIEGAKDYLKKNKKAEDKFDMIQSLEKIKAFLLELKAQL